MMLSSLDEGVFRIGRSRCNRANTAGPQSEHGGSRIQVAGGAIIDDQRVVVDDPNRIGCDQGLDRAGKHFWWQRVAA